MNKPYHEHDCNCCHFLGSMLIPSHFKNHGYPEEMDLYYHPGKHDTVIARFGVDGDYMSGVDFAKSAVREVLQRQKARTPREALEFVVEHSDSLTYHLLSLATLKAMDAGYLDEEIQQIEK